MRSTAALLAAALAPAATSRTGAGTLTVINSLGPVLLNETVASFVPNFAAAGSAVSVKVAGSAAPATVLRQADGIVHWLNEGPQLDQRSYQLCVDGACGPPATLNAAELWWHQCVGSSSSMSAAQPSNGLACTPGGVLRIFGKALAFDSAVHGGSPSRCAPYQPYVHGGAATAAHAPASTRILLRAAGGGASASVELAAATQSCYDATFVLPASLRAGNYTLMVKGNLPSSTWQLARDPDQHTLTVATPTTCDAVGKTITVTSAATLKQALAASHARPGGVTVAVEGTIVLTQKDGPLVLPQCTVLKGSQGGGSGNSVSKLQFSGCGKTGPMVPLIGPDPLGGGSATVESLEIQALALDGGGAEYAFFLH